MESENVKIAEGWNVLIEREGNGYKIVLLQALLGFRWLAINTEEFSENEWHYLHSLVAKGETEKD